MSALRVCFRARRNVIGCGGIAAVPRELTRSNFLRTRKGRRRQVQPLPPNRVPLWLNVRRTNESYSPLGDDARERLRYHMECAGSERVRSGPRCRQRRSGSRDIFQGLLCKLAAV